MSCQESLIRCLNIIMLMSSVLVTQKDKRSYWGMMGYIVRLKAMRWPCYCSGGGGCSATLWSHITHIGAAGPGRPLCIIFTLRLIHFPDGCHCQRDNSELWLVDGHICLSAACSNTHHHRGGGVVGLWVWRMEWHCQGSGMINIWELCHP